MPCHVRCGQDRTARAVLVPSHTRVCVHVCRSPPLTCTYAGLPPQAHKAIAAALRSFAGTWPYGGAVRDGPVHNWATLGKAAQAKAAFALRGQQQARAGEGAAGEEEEEQPQGRQLLQRQGQAEQDQAEEEEEGLQAPNALPRLGVIPPCTSSE